MRKVLLLALTMLFIISMNVCYYKMATEVLDATGKVFMKKWQWASIGLFFAAIQFCMYGCNQMNRTEKLILVTSSSVLYFTMGIIILTLNGNISNPYVCIISYNNFASVIFLFLLISAIYSRTINLSFSLKKSRKK